MHTPEPISGTVLVIDSKENVQQHRAGLEDAGFTVVSAPTAKDGIELARKIHPDLVVSEVMLETPDAGFTLGYRLKSDPALANVPLILLSSIFKSTGIVFDLNSPEGRQWIKADAYLERPIPTDRLVARARSLLQHRDDGNSEQKCG